MLVLRKPGDGGRVAYFTGRMGKTYFDCRLPDHGRLIAETARWCVDGDVPLRVEGPSSLDCSLRRKGDAAVVHCVNLAGGRRFYREFTPVRDARVGIREDWGEAVTATMMDGGAELQVEREDGYWMATVPEVTDYDAVVFRKAQRRT
jgi:hypothetical protein